MSLPTPYYDDGDGIQIYLGDCRLILPHLPKVDLCLTDPPYPNGAGHFVEHIASVYAALKSVSASRFMVFWHQLSLPPVSLQLVAHHIWHRTNTNRPDNYEPIYEFAEERERHSRVFPHAVIFPGLTGCYEATGHPTQKPEDLMKELIELRKGMQTILDPFMGSGTTLVAAQHLGRKAIGIEISQAYCDIAIRRLSQQSLPLTEPLDGSKIHPQEELYGTPTDRGNQEENISCQYGQENDARSTQKAKRNKEALIQAGENKNPMGWNQGNYDMEQEGA